ncbi:SDR family NAD(P)-dependent oxidoreductase [Chitinophaga sp. Cy-1792]|uniref:SDR family NAD(P)-dependent oxidoreductase n=1 Tax=Chitinophaga sp. Cy-1792 TaxID=2608339 RepID=UPI0014216ED6|nr:SDR family NAD(P)-dependent oxidoreductase [Chitinophaga sp. Cy-1792]NIG54581.1 SDR family NAD(P)-dependent oxidoreductase [Chitinophaga sp. Cy-1792]
MFNPTYPVISILGCGWVGKPLAVHLASIGYRVKGSRTTAEGVAELHTLGIEGYTVRLKEDAIEGDNAPFWDADVIIIDVPPRMQRGDHAFVAEMETLAVALEQTRIRHVIFVSSTSVYPNINDKVYEDCNIPPDKPNGVALLKAEKVLLNKPGFNTVVLRFGGLAGFDRLPNTQKKVNDPRAQDTPLNLIHRADCIGVIERVLEKDIWGEVFNACASGHPLRFSYHVQAAAHFDLQRPRRKEPEDDSYKIVTNTKVKDLLGYRFKYDSPLQFFDDKPPKSFTEILNDLDVMKITTSDDGR